LETSWERGATRGGSGWNSSVLGVGQEEASVVCLVAVLSFLALAGDEGDQKFFPFFTSMAAD
jgi:hypothetical protein